MLGKIILILIMVIVAIIIAFFLSMGKEPKFPTDLKD